jgi:isoleucyl-tRNA synthetase
MKVDFQKLEKKILKFWKKNDIFNKSINQRSKSKNFVFYDGPITANARPGIHHTEARIFKDIIPRYKTMQGFRVERKNGWDTHGLPVELEVEKKLKFHTKHDIENYGISRFNKACKRNVKEYIPLLKDFTERIGYWVDMENSYITFETDYIETVWWIIKQIYKKGLLYKGHKVVPFCPRCGTSLSSHEVAQGYKKIKEPAIYVKLRIKNQNNYLLVWTTTPWTLPGNVAVAVNPNFRYAKVKVGADYFILAKERLEVLNQDYEVVEEMKGKDLLGLEYEPLFAFVKPDKKAHYVIAGDFVTVDEGTGLVHIAPAFGEDDMEVSKSNNLPVILNVNEEGKFKKEVKKWAGMDVKKADPLIIEDLRKRNLLFKTEHYEHDYPFCWRCNSHLLYYAKENWFINMQKVKKDLISNNQKINWIPSHLKEGRFGEWLREVKDWALSRERYWGTPLPVWQCKECNHLDVIGSKKDLLSKKYTTNKYFILRHGQTINQVRKEPLIYDWPSISTYPLTKKGKQQILKVAKKLKTEKIDLIYSSDSLRTRQTAKIVAKELGVKVYFDKRLRDVNLGVYAGKIVKEFHRDFTKEIGRFNRGPDKGESWLNIKRRVLPIIREIDKKHRGKTILIVSHGDPLWILEGMMKGWTNEKLLKEKVKRGTIKIAELRKIEFKNLPYNQKGNLDFHRPHIDKVKFFCPKCQNLMQRTTEVIDCWFDSGTMPFAQYHYPFENKKLIDKGVQFPADYIAEAIDQTRGWFYTLLAISTLLGFTSPFKNVLSLGHVLDEKGEKMSKSKGNLVDPWFVIEKYSADALRWYFFTVNQPYDPKLFSEKDVKEALKKFILTLWNCFVFFDTYAAKTKNQKPKTKNILDKWIISRLNKLILEVSGRLDNFDITQAARLIEDFVIEDLSQWYIRRSRMRFQGALKQDLVKDKNFLEASNALRFVLFNLIKITAPFIPFLSEEIYQRINRKSKVKSVHLEDWPKIDKRAINKGLNKKMSLTRKIVSLGLKARSESQLKVRQPLSKLQIANYKLQTEFLNLIKEELNVKEKEKKKNIKKRKSWIIAKEEELKITLNTKVTPQLRKEGEIREFVRLVQEMRKRAGLKPKDRILVQFSGPSKFKDVLSENRRTILKKVKAEDMRLLAKEKMATFNTQQEVQIGENKGYLGIKKIK